MAMGEIFTGPQGGCHIQGIAVDEKRRFIYCSFTTKLIKYDFEGNIVGSVTGLTGHMGCITFCAEDGRVYGSLEYKNDTIGRGVRRSIGVQRENEDAFYLVSFDTEKITQPDMDAFSGGIMRAMYLKEATDDYLGTGMDNEGLTVPHRYGCSGVDGTGYAPLPGEKSGEKYLMVAYGVYHDKNRSDNDNQIILAYTRDTFDRFAQPLCEEHMHRLGPLTPAHKYFVYTGNTDWGVQNLEYDAYTGDIFLAVYPGSKPQFKNRPLLRINGKIGAKPQRIPGCDETGEMLTLVDEGMDFAYGSTGMYAFGDGGFLFSHNDRVNGEECAYLRYYRFDREKSTFICGTDSPNAPDRRQGNSAITG